MSWSTKFALQQMQLEHDKAEPLGRRQVERLGRSLVEIRAECERKDVDNDGAEIFDHENGLPGDLRS